MTKSERKNLPEYLRLLRKEADLHLPYASFYISECDPEGAIVDVYMDDEGQRWRMCMTVHFISDMEKVRYVAKDTILHFKGRMYCERIGYPGQPISNLVHCKVTDSPNKLLVLLC